MDKIKPYLFWIICGAILLIEIVMFVVMDPVNENNHNVLTATKKLNTSVKDFQSKFVSRTQEDPPPSFAIDDVAYFNRIQDNYLVSQSWSAGLQQVERDLDTHKQNVEESLRKKSEILHQPITQSTSKADWYSSYLEQTAELLKKLHEQDQLSKLPNDPFAARDATDEAINEIYRINNKIRAIAGFYTKGLQFPGPEEHPIITTRFRISQAIINAALESQAALINNNMIEFDGTSFILPADKPVKPQLMEIIWDSGNSKWDTENRIGIKGGNAITFKVKAQGSAAALLALTANIEKSQDPIFIIHGSEWTQPRFLNRRDVEKAMDAEIVMTLDMAVLDYQGGQ